MKFTLLISLVATFLTACHPNNPSLTEAKAPVIVKTAIVKTYASQSASRYPAVVVRDRESTVSFRVPGVISQLPWHVGDVIHKGQILAKIESEPYSANQKKLQMELQTVQRLVNRNETLYEAGGIPGKELQDRKDNAASIQAAYDAATYDLQSTIKVSPQNGIVIAKYLEIGETVQPGQPLLKIADKDSALLARVSVPAEVVIHLHINDTAKVFQSADGTSIVAHIKRIGAYSSTTTGNIEVDVALPSKLNLASGSVLSVTFQPSLNGSLDLVTLPTESVIEVSGTKLKFWVLNGDSIQPASAEFIRFNDDGMIVSGLSAGMKVITTGASLLKLGDRVQEVQL